MDLVSYFEEVLTEMPRNDGNEKPVIALVGREAKNWDAAVLAAKNVGAQVVTLEEGLPMHKYKRLLNEYHCDCLMYSRDYEELAYHVENTGTTLVHAFICLEEEA